MKNEKGSPTKKFKKNLCESKINQPNTRLGSSVSNSKATSLG